MARIKNTLLTPELNEILVKALDPLPNPVLLEMGRCMPGSFTRAEPIRLRLAEMLRSDKPIPPWLLLILRSYTPGVQVVRPLSIEGLKELVDILILLKGRDTVALPLLLDAREEVHQLGAQVLARKQHIPLKADHAAATRALCQFIDCHLLTAADTSITPAGDAAPKLPEMPVPEEVDLQEVRQLIGELSDRFQKQLKANESLQKGLQEQSQKHKERLDKTVRQAAEEVKRIRAERDEARQQLLRLNEEKAALAARLDQLNARVREEVARGVAEGTTALVRKWLSVPVQEERQLAVLKANGADLLARAEAALAAQALQDRATGNRLELEAKLNQLREMHARLLTAAQTALRPLPELQATLAAVEEALRRTEGLLSNGRPGDSLTDKLLVRINGAGTWAEAQKQGEVLQQLADAELLPDKERRRLYDALHRKFSLLAETEKPAEADVADHGWSLREVLYRNRLGLVLLDGHNLLFRLEDIFRPHYDPDGHPGRQARERLIAIVRKLLQDRSNVRMRICFDAPKHEKMTVCSNLEVEYSGGKGEHRADQRIGEQVAWRRPDELDQKWYVVTDDRAVRREAVANGARYVPVDVFAVLLADFRCLTEEPKIA